MRWGDAGRCTVVGTATLAAAIAGLVSSSVVSLSLWLALRLVGDERGIAVLGASVGVVAWICLLFCAGIAVSSDRMPRVSPAEGRVLAVAFVGPLVIGVLIRKYLQLLHPDALPPSQAYVELVLPTAVMLAVIWLTVGRRVASRLRKRDAEP